MSWLKLTSKALYLMAPGSDKYTQSVPVKPNSSANANELGTELPSSWFTKDNFPKRLIIDLKASEPSKFSS
jgi:hypothetical protein